MKKNNSEAIDNTDAEICLLMQIFKATKLYTSRCKQWNVTQIRDMCQRGLSYTTAKRGKPVFQVGFPASAAYLVMKGQLQMRTDQKKASVANGRRGGSQLPGINRDAIHHLSSELPTVP